jgi:hypothetical protein
MQKLSFGVEHQASSIGQGRYKYRSGVPKQKKTPTYRIPGTSLEFAFGLPVTSKGSLASIGISVFSCSGMPDLYF